MPIPLLAMIPAAMSAIGGAGAGAGAGGLMTAGGLMQGLQGADKIMGLMGGASGSRGGAGDGYLQAGLASAPNQAVVGMGSANPSDGMAMAFAPIKDDADFMSRMNTGEFDDMANNPDMNKGVMDYLNQPASSITSQQIGAQGLAQSGKMGMSGLTDMSNYAQATPVQGLMSQATAGIRPAQQRSPFPMQQGLMNTWGG